MKDQQNYTEFRYLELVSLTRIRDILFENSTNCSDNFCEMVFWWFFCDKKSFSVLQKLIKQTSDSTFRNFIFYDLMHLYLFFRTIKTGALHQASTKTYSENIHLTDIHPTHMIEK